MSILQFTACRYYQCLEKVKLKNNLITKLQKKNIDAESRLK